MPTHVVSVNTTGSAGSATGTARTELAVRGLIMGIRLDYHASAPATTNVTITEDSGMQRTILTRSASATDAIFYPVVQQHDTSAAPIAGQYGQIYVNGAELIVSVTNSNALTPAIVVSIDVLEG